MAPEPAADTRELTRLANIGPVLAQRLAGIGVTTAGQLAAIGAVGAVRRLSSPEDPACYNTMYALAGAIAGVRWHDLPVPQRHRLRDELWAGQS